MRWVIKDFARLHHTTKRYLAAATPTWEGDYMKDAARTKHHHPGDYLVIALFNNHHLIGWAMLDMVLSKQSRLLRTYIFVKEKHRRKGYGTIIIKKVKEVAKRRGKGIRVLPHDKRSRKFFQSVNITRSEVAPGYQLC